MKRIGFAVLGFNRPRYMYITLDSIFRASRVSDYEIFCCVDGTEPGMIVKYKEVFGNFDVPVHFNLIRHRTLDHYMHVYRLLFNHGYDFVCILEDDIIVKPDIFTRAKRYLDHVGEEFFFSLCGRGPSSQQYRSRGNILSREKYHYLSDFVCNRKYVGLHSTAYSRNFRLTDCLHQPLFDEYMRMEGKYTAWAGDFYTLTFGVYGSLNGYYNEEAKVMERRFFSGDKDTWLDNVLKIFQDKDYPECLSSFAFWPRKFSYEDNGGVGRYENLS